MVAAVSLHCFDNSRLPPEAGSFSLRRCFHQVWNIIGTEMALKRAACVDHPGGFSCSFYFLVVSVCACPGQCRTVFPSLINLPDQGDLLSVD